MLLPTPSSIVLGGGILGLSVARELALRSPGVPVALFEKESRLAAHQTGRNSGVIHSGLYYSPGSAKASLCKRGRLLLEAFCTERNIPWERCGKVVVATTEEQQSGLARLADRGRANGLELEEIGPERLGEIEPHVRGLGALHIPSTGIVDYTQVCEHLAADLLQSGGSIHLESKVKRVQPVPQGARVELVGGERLDASTVVNCTGLHVDRIARGSGAILGARIVPFRGEYYSLSADASHLCRNLIYPVPDPRFPFLGVHFTRGIKGVIECGPNAVLALAREGYRKRDINLRDLWDTGSWPGTWRLLAKHWRAGCGEAYRSLSKAAFARALRQLIPEIAPGDLTPSAAGVRAQALLRNGNLLDDFAIQRQGPITHLLNAPSPAASACLAIAEVIAQELQGDR